MSLTLLDMIEMLSKGQCAFTAMNGHGSCRGNATKENVITVENEDNAPAWQQGIWRTPPKPITNHSQNSLLRFLPPGTWNDSIIIFIVKSS